jgi:hypothetical protein
MTHEEVLRKLRNSTQGFRTEIEQIEMLEQDASSLQTSCAKLDIAIGDFVPSIAALRASIEWAQRATDEAIASPAVEMNKRLGEILQCQHHLREALSLVTAYLESAKERIFSSPQWLARDEGSSAHVDHHQEESVAAPKIAEKLLSLLLPAETQDALLGCLQEGFRRKAKLEGLKEANQWYWWQFGQALGPTLVRAVIRLLMLRELLDRLKLF